MVETTKGHVRFLCCNSATYGTHKSLSYKLNCLRLNVCPCEHHNTLVQNKIAKVKTAFPDRATYEVGGCQQCLATGDTTHELNSLDPARYPYTLTRLR
ncbi:unnamed protein product, partial [Brenthis ino]